MAIAPAKVNKVPPDGGYGWVIVCATALSNVIMIPLMQSFGLLFKDTFTEMGLSATRGSLIINLNAAFGMLTGLINGALLKKYGYRKVALISAGLTFVGILSTSFANSFTHFMISYGLITSLGMGLSMSAFNLALNTYFRTNRSRAVGYSMTISGLGPILMPQLITLLSRFYNIREVIFILSALTLHCFAAAFLLRPVKWYMKIEKSEETKLETIDEEASESHEENTQNGFQKKRPITRSISAHNYERDNDEEKGSTWSIDPEIEAAGIYGMDSALGGSVMSLNITNSPRSRANSMVSQTWKTQSNLNMQHLVPKSELQVQDVVYNPELSKPIKRKPLMRRFVHRLSKMFDLDLFKDPIYVNIMIGMSLAIFAEINFSVSTAFILADLGLTMDQIATFMSVLGITDIIFRFLAPYISDYCHQPARVMYMATLFMLMATRFMLLVSSNVFFLTTCSLFLGVAKGFRTVYMSLVIPSYVPIEKLPSAFGIQMMVNGIFILIGGPIVGYVRDVTGSYNWCIVFINVVTFTTVAMWSLEYLVITLRRKNPDVENSAENTEQKNSLLV